MAKSVGIYLVFGVPLIATGVILIASAIYGYSAIARCQRLQREAAGHGV